ncbi:mucin-5AC-like [Thunnus thynnus]|uniref:mucin-5AC-like n=1 Tax=Thunnus thynnus TaxID=8237 RepID=UPI003528CCD6
MTCGWSEWINLGKPTPGPNGGENETIQNIISAGYHVCSTPEEVQCRAVLYPSLPLSEVGQAVTCNKDVGLICNNKQQGLQGECFDYEIKFKCCRCPTPSTAPTNIPTSTPSTTTYVAPSSTTETITTQKPTTTTTSTPTTTTETTTTQTPTNTTTTTPSTATETTTTQTPTTTTPPTTPSTTSETTSTTQAPTTTTTATTPSTVTETTTTTRLPTTTLCPGGHDMTCGWSEWINLGKPTPGPNGGENETIQNIISAGYHVCSTPEEVQCRAVLYPSLPLSEVGQAVTCNKDVGLICNNKQQGLQGECFDYEIKFKCCRCPTPSTAPTNIPTSTPSTTTYVAPSSTTETITTQKPTTTTTSAPTTTSETTTTQTPTTTTTTTPSTATETTTTQTPTTTTPPTTPSTTSETTSTTQAPTTTTTATTPSTVTETTTTTRLPTTTLCQGGHDMTCGWSEWINLGKPTPGPNGGENETIQNIISAGYHVCSTPEEVQCRAVLYPSLPLSEVGQAVTCNKDVGLICNNKQQGLQGECFDYEIKFKCCRCPTPSTAPTNIPTSTPSTTTYVAPSSTTETTTTQTPTTTTTTTPSTATETTTTQTPTTTTPPTTPSTTSETTSTTQAPTTTTTATTPSTVTETTTTTRLPTTTLCPGGHDMTCGWSEWINLGKPTPGPNGGENETIQNIISAGYHVCSTPEEVQCRAVLYPSLPLSEVGQAVTCNKDVGLICNNKQQGLQSECFDYEIKFKCCRCPTPSTAPTNIPTSTPSTTTYVAPSSTTETITTQKPTTTTTSTPTTTTETTTTQTPTTTTTTTPSTATETTTTQTPTTTTPPTTPSTTSETTSTTQAPTTTTTATTPSTVTETTTTTRLPTTTLCPGGHDMTCGWSEWINLGKPTPGPNGGENETIQNIISAGYHVCSTPEEVQCRAVLYPSLPLSEVGQAVTCNKDVGLICNNKQQGLQGECFDYEIKFKCCRCPTPSTAPTNIPTSTPSTTTYVAPSSTTETITTQKPTTTTTSTPTTTTETTTTQTPTTTTTTTPSTATETTTTQTPTTTTPPTTPSTTSETTSTTQAPTTTTTATTPSTVTETTTTTRLPTTTLCPGGHDMTCGWSEWINLGKPTPGPNGGENETIQNIISAGYHVCSTPEEVQCRAVLYPSLPLSEVSNTINCPYKYSNFNTFNYHIRSTFQHN